MPYTLRTAPVKDVLPKAALRIWIRTFNAVLDETDDEDAARQAAWSNVKEAGFRKGEDGKWAKAAAVDDTLVVADAGLRILDTTEAMALPKATLSKVYAEFKYASFNEPNANHDGFLGEDVSAEHLETLIGSPIYLKEDATDHPLKTARASKRAPFYAGSILRFERKDDGIYCLGAFQRETLQDRGMDPTALDRDFSVSMEVTFDRRKAKYRVGDRTMPYAEALEEGIAAPVGTPDDPTKYDARFIVPIDFHGTALLSRGRNADKTADILRVAAAEDEIEWSRSDYDLYVKASEGSRGAD